jgi:hypothetical protein
MLFVHLHLRGYDDDEKLSTITINLEAVETMDTLETMEGDIVILHGRIRFSSRTIEVRETREDILDMIKAHVTKPQLALPPGTVLKP